MDLVSHLTFSERLVSIDRLPVKPMARRLLVRRDRRPAPDGPAARGRLEAADGCPGERTRFHRRHGENRKEVIPQWRRRRWPRRRARRRRLRRRRSKRIVWTWHVLGGLVAHTANPRLMQAPLAVPEGEGLVSRSDLPEPRRGARMCRRVAPAPPEVRGPWQRGPAGPGRAGAAPGGVRTGAGGSALGLAVPSSSRRLAHGWVSRSPI